MQALGGTVRTTVTPDDEQLAKAGLALCLQRQAQGTGTLALSTSGSPRPCTWTPLSRIRRARNHSVRPQAWQLDPEENQLLVLVLA